LYLGLRNPDAERKAGGMLSEIERMPGERSDITSSLSDEVIYTQILKEADIHRETALTMHGTNVPRITWASYCEIATELWIAREKLSTPGHNYSDGTIVPSGTWASYCESIGLEKRKQAKDNSGGRGQKGTQNSAEVNQ